MIRPENLGLRARPESALALDGSIKEVVYLGSYIRYVAELPSGDLLTVEEQNLPGAARAVVGEAVTIYVAPEHCLVLNETGSTG